MIDQYPPANGVLTSLIWRKTAVGGETSLSGYDNASQALSYTPGQEQVYLNGILLVRALDYTATNGTSITGLTALAADDFVQINCYNNFSVASVPTASLTGTVTNDQLAGSIANNKLANSSITINGSAVSLGGSVSLAGDIESVTAGTGISGGGSSGAVTITNSMATAIDAKGDLVVGTGADTFSKLTVGANGTTLVADSSESVGMKWAAPGGAGANWSLVNSGGTSLSGTSTTVSGITDADKLLILVDGALLNNNTGAVIGLRLNADTGSNYAFMGARNYPNGTTFYAQMFGAAGSIAADSIPLFNNPDFVNRPGYAYALLSGCNSSGLKVFNLAGGVEVGYTSQAYQQQRIHGGWYSGSSAISSITIFGGSGSFTGGSVYVYKSA
jgi:hypothetical protein